MLTLYDIMKRYLKFSRSWAVIALISAVIFACKDDDPVIPVVQFQQTSQTVDEAAGTIDVVVQLNVSAPRAITVRYGVSGTASEGSTPSGDFQINSTTARELTIAEGASSGSIQLQIKDDAVVEVDETIILTLESVVNDAATFGTNKATTITIGNDDLGAKVSFASASQTVNENSGLVEVEITLDAPASQALTVSYSFNRDLGDDTPAVDSVYAFGEGIPPWFYDFYVEGNSTGQLTVPAGATSAKIPLRILSDFYLEDDEIIEINLTAVTGGGQLGTATKHTITVLQEDGRIIALFWDPNHTDVDMDLILWIGEDENTLEVWATSINASTTVKQEVLFIPKVFSDGVDATYGLSFVYYEGTANPMNFEVHHVDFADSEFEADGDRNIYASSYTLANLNPWETADDLVHIEQTFRTVSGAFTDLSAITVPTSGSRMKTYKIPEKFVRKASPNVRRVDF